MNYPSLTLNALYGYAPRQTYYPSDPRYAGATGLVKESPSVTVAREISAYTVIGAIFALVAIRVAQEYL